VLVEGTLRQAVGPAGSPPTTSVVSIQGVPGGTAIPVAQTSAAAGPTTGTPSNATVTTGLQTTLAANAARRGASFWSESTSTVYLALFTPATTSSYTVQLSPANPYYELPQPVYTGIITHIGSAAQGNLRITEMT
jgi:hypothetical protein